MKYRIEINYYKSTHNGFLYLTCFKILLKNIKSVVINNKEYFRNEYKNTIELGKYYKLIKNNLNIITEIKRERVFYKINNKFLHNINEPAYSTYIGTSNGIDRYFKKYYIEGKEYSKEDWLLKSREIKIKNILEKI